MALTVAEQLRAAHVRRWHIVQVAREQTLAEHLYCVAIISGSLAQRMRWDGLLHYSQKIQLLNWALTHDIMEVRTGDTPTPFKRALEKVAGKNIVEAAEAEIDGDALGLYRQIRNTPIEMIVKLADLLEAIKFLDENGLGDHAQSVLDGIRKDFSDHVDDAEKKYPKLNVRESVREVCAEIGVWSGVS